MKKRPLFFLILGVVVACYGCSSHELQLRFSGATSLNQSELEQLFYADRNVDFSSSSGGASVRYFPDGRQEIEWSSGKDSGTFRIENEEFCSTWSRLRNGAESCSKIYKISETVYEFIGSDGTSAGIMQIK
jgi:hypothetical protein